MIDTLKNILYISISNKINFLIYYFKRLPLVGKLLKDSAYKELKLKKLIEEKFKNLIKYIGILLLIQYIFRVIRDYFT